MKYSIRKISEISGFSPATVSNALNHKRGVNVQTAEEILSVARQVGYIKAKKVERIRFLIFRKNGLIIIDNPFFSQVIESAEKVCHECGYDMIVSNLDLSQVDYRDRIKDIISDETTGILLLATELTKEEMQLFREVKAPFVVLDAWFDDMDFFTVQANDEDSVRKAVAYLVENGHTQIGYLSGKYRTRNFIGRGVGFRRAIRDNMLTLNNDYVFKLTPTLDDSYKDMCSYLGAGRDIPTAFFADNDVIAIGAMKALKQFGYKIPGDISVVGFDDYPYSSIFSPPLTTVKFYQNEMGRLGAQSLIDKIKHPNIINVRIQIGTKLQIRDSVKNIK